MKAILETPKERTTLEQRAILLEEYRKALREWSRARLCNPSNDQAPEVLASLIRITELEQMLRKWACRQHGLTTKH